MNKHDQNNLNFLLNVDKETLANWYASVGEDDHKYAMEILNFAEQEQEVKKVLLDDEEHLDCTEARSALSKFTLKGLK